MGVGQRDGLRMRFLQAGINAYYSSHHWPRFNTVNSSGGEFGGLSITIMDAWLICDA
jgi:hypothetical protein